VDSGLDVVAAVAEVLQGRPAIERRHVQIGALDKNLIEAISALDMARRDRLLNEALEAIGVRVLNAQLTSRRYTLVLDQAEASRLQHERLDADRLERRINERLEDAVR